jgi:hypothetical protein
MYVTVWDTPAQEHSKAAAAAMKIQKENIILVRVYRVIDKELLALFQIISHQRRHRTLAFDQKLRSSLVRGPRVGRKILPSEKFLKIFLKCRKLVISASTYSFLNYKTPKVAHNMTFLAKNFSLLSHGSLSLRQNIGKWEFFERSEMTAQRNRAGAAICW